MANRRKADAVVGKHLDGDVARGRTGGRAGLRAIVVGGRESWNADRAGAERPGKV
jgi:hypothetical protein